MSVVSLLLRDLVGMFFDDEFLALAILAVVAAAAAAEFLAGSSQLVTGAVLFVGCLVVLVASCLRASRKA